MTEKKPATPAASTPTSSREPSMRRRQPDQGEIAPRAYFIDLEGGSSTSKGAAAISSETGRAQSANS